MLHTLVVQGIDRFSGGGGGWGWGGGGGVRVAGGGPTQRVFLRDLENSVYIRNITQCKVMVFPEGLCPEENIITEGNISPNPPSGGSINNIL
jgi:hypothetical protein